MGKELIELKVDGMDCNNCAMSISRYLERKGLEDVFVNFQTKEVRFASGGGDLGLDKIKSGIEKLGYTVLEEEPEPVFWTFDKKLLVSALFTLPLLLGHLLMMVGWAPAWLMNPWVQLGLTLPPFIIGVVHFGGSALSSLRGGVPNMDVLIFLGSTAAFVYSVFGLVLQNPDYYFFETVATIITLVLLGNWLEKRAVAQTTTAIGELTQLQATSARKILPSGQLVEIPQKELKIGMLLQINEGDRIPADGTLVQGEGLVDESMLTGESMPAAKELSAELIGGSLLLKGNLQMKVTASGKNTVLEQMVELVKTAQQDKPPIQQLADKISAIFVPAVVGISLLTFLLGHFAFGLTATQALLNAIAVLVISCPCAMGLATPTAVMVGVGRLAKLGVLIKGGRTVEQLATIKNIVFDKTGTLTTGKFRVEKAEYPTGEMKKANSLVWAMEQYSSHPIAVSLREALEGMPRAEALSELRVEEERGIGMTAVDETGIRYRLGSKRLLENDADCDGDIFLLREKDVLAVFKLGDDLKKGVSEAIQALEGQGRNSFILSGDRADKTQMLAEKIGVKEYHAEKLPAEKLSIIKKISEKHPTAMVGDGINDAPALAQADLGISLSSASQVAIQSAKVVLLKGRIDVLPEAFGIAEKTVETIRQNLFWAFAYNIVAIPIAAMGFLNPMWGALFMAFSDVVVIGNSIRLKYKKV
ncbi:heavy metal translocating P-type ATPase [Lewinella cohaerens]|uniref:heavy metal translocating P-type ATPase n=1 Tax=Lewinella cohaerens TaxID=70995 RepID=UPI000371355B|nr:cation-translocating P-type ATPase [Lewinella cohaerens]